MRSGQPSRRKLLHSLLGLCVWPCLAAAASSAAGQLSEALNGFSRTTVVRRRYRADATILLLGVPIFTRRDVGGGYATLEVGETGASGDSRAAALQFAAGSSPARAGGLNRFGMLREVVVEREGKLSGFSFSGLITRSSEQNLDQGRDALARGAAPQEATVAFGEAGSNGVRSSTQVVRLSPGSNWSGAAEELERVLDGCSPAAAAPHAQGGVAPFLYVMRQAGLDRSPRSRWRFIHAGKTHSLEVHRQPSHPNELTGEIHDEAGMKTAEFRVSYDPQDDSGIPCRIEYRARSFLRLVFESDSSATQPVIPSVFS
jgi:hypothetical protein